MKKKKRLRLTITSLFLILVLFSAPVAARHPAQDIMYLYAGDLPDLNFVEPYVVGILALHELEQGRRTAEVKRFLIWYLEKLNHPDRYNIDGTIYDYVLRRDWEMSHYTYDSIDGYSGLFLHLLLKYTEKTGDQSLAEEYWGDVEKIARTLALVQEGDGLTIALVTTNEKYLSDNCEAYGGVSAYLRLRELLRKPPRPSYVNIRDNIKKGLFTHMYDRKKGIFSYIIEDGEVADTSWERYYPDAYGQLFLIYYGLLEDNPKMIKHIWETFEARHGSKYREFPLAQRMMYLLTKMKVETQYKKHF